MRIINCTVLDGDFKFVNKDIVIENGIIKELCEPCPEYTSIFGEGIYDAKGNYVIPGITDIHFHGCAGKDFCDATDDAISVMARYERSVGVTQICPATMTIAKDRIEKICEVAAGHIRGDEEAELVGINLEGPFISPKRCGAQNPEHVIKADSKFLRHLIDVSGGLVKLCTIAPEEEGAISCIEELKDEIRFSIGHTVATYDEATKGFDAGAKHMTHLFNAMPGLTHREPGPIAAGMERDYVTPEMICDGIHIHKATIRAAFKMFGENRIILISDSTRACGMPDGEYELGGLPIFKKDGAARLEDGTLAGSSTDLMECMQNVISFGIKKEDAIKAATLNPARAIGIDDRFGSIEPGKVANLVILDEDNKVVDVITR